MKKQKHWGFPPKHVHFSMKRLLKIAKGIATQRGIEWDEISELRKTELIAEAQNLLK